MLLKKMEVESGQTPQRGGLAISGAHKRLRKRDGCGVDSLEC